MASMTAPISETYTDVEKLIYHTVHRFIQGGPSQNWDFDELVQEANLVYMKVYKAFDPERGAFSTLLVTSIYRRLTDLYRNAQQDKKFWGTSIDKSYNDSDDTMASQIEGRPDRKFDKAEFAGDLTEDGRVVLSLVLEPSKFIEAEAVGKGNEARNWKSTIRNHLYDLGWTASRISSSFNEIADALK